MTYDLSILIPARNESYYDLDLLGHTITNVLENTSDKCQVVTVLDGAWSLNPLPSHPRLTLIHHNKSIGQRAATNEAARIATGTWLCKLDAHCAVDKDFDTKLIAGMEDDWTVVPGQYNLQAFQWKCKKCGWLKDQSPKPAKCGKCGSQYIKLIPLWFPRDGRENSDGVGGKRTAYTHNWRFDTDLCFQYWGEGAANEDYCKRHKVPFRPEMQGKVHDTMCLLGACWAIKRDRYFDLNICDELFGSWGSQGVEVAIKSQLSGGRLVVNQNTWFAHFFRVGGINFPYEGGGRKERAVARSKELFLKNQWPKQVYPLSWLIDKFSPVPDWDVSSNPIRAAVNEEGALFHSKFSSLGLPSHLLANSTSLLSSKKPVALVQSKVPSVEVSTPTVRSSGSVHVNSVSDQTDVQGITAGTGVANDVIQFGLARATERQRLDQPSVSKAVNLDVPVDEKELSIARVIESAQPNPAAGFIKTDLGKETSKSSSVDVGNGKVFSSHDSASNAGLRSGSELRDERDSDSSIVPRKTLLYYTCNSHDLTLELAARNNLKAATNGHELGCVSRERTDFGDWNIVVDREKSGTTMHYQILAGLERSTADYVFLCESDVFYHQSHFDFTPPDDETFFYNTNVWRIRYSDGHAVRTDNLQQVSGICASRKLLLNHYRRRIEWIEKNGGVFSVKAMAYEPGTRGKFGDEKVANWESEFPNVDVTGHGETLTTPHFSVDSFRNKKYAQGWKETDDALDGWPKLSGGAIHDWLKRLANE